VTVSILFQHPITIVGENHNHADSTKWFLTTVTEYVKKGKCLNVALEIESSQQATLKAAMAGDIPISSIQINSIIDHPGYRQMLAGLGNLTGSGNCFNVYAIDAPHSENVNRDEWMTEQIFRIGKNAPTMALLGNLHALKYVDWYSEANGEPFLAERLHSIGMDVFSVIQDWPSGDCNSRQDTMVTVDTREGKNALNHVLEPVAANLPHNPESVIDLAIIWSCK